MLLPDAVALPIRLPQSPQDGEIAAYKVADGDPVEYGGAIVCLAPFFGMEDAGKTQLRGIQ